MKRNHTAPGREETDRLLERLRREAMPLFKQWNRPEHLFDLSATKASFIIIDMQNFSCAPTSGEALPRIGEVVTRINRLADLCRTASVPVIWVRQNFTTTADGSDAGLYPAFHDIDRMKSLCNRDEGTAIYPPMHFDPRIDHVVFKNRYSAFLSNPPELREKLESLKRTQLLVAGIAANVCVESTVRDAMQLDYETVLVSDGITASAEMLFESTLRNTMFFFGDVRSTDEVMDALRRNTNEQSYD